MSTVLSVGMVDHLDGAGSGPTEAEIAFVKAYLAEGPMDPALLAQAMSPERMAERAARTAELRTRDWPNLGQYRDANAAVTKPVKAVFIGDSYTEFWQAAHPDFFSNGIIGRGISGQTSQQMLLRFTPDVVALKPSCVHILAGANDVAGNTGPSTPQDYKNNMLAMITLAQAHGIRIILGGLTLIEAFPWSPGVNPAAWLTELNAWIRATASEMGLIYADYPSVLANAGRPIRSDFSRDGVHPTAKGYAAMRPVAEAALARVLGDGYPGRAEAPQ
ncbi:MAG TPA: GDSL-type esterase/lipase family protein [Steroidobacteraceae bacterium]|nr:GDSL-type esterase/lipase family protein [Steroidobacteraceae bacterium]